MPFPGTNNSGPAMKRHQFRITVERLKTWKGHFYPKLATITGHYPLV